MKQYDRQVSIDAEVWVSDLLHKATDEELHQEMNNRSLGNDSNEAVGIAINQIRRGENADAITTLERMFMPKWSSVDGCRTHYALAM